MIVHECESEHGHYFTIGTVITVKGLDGQLASKKSISLQKKAHFHATGLSQPRATYSPYQLVPTGVRSTAQYTVKIVTWPSAWKYAKNNVSSIFNRINNNSPSPSPSQSAQLYCYQLVPTVICDRADSSWLEPRTCTLSPSLGCISTSSSGVCCIYSSLPASSVSRACSSGPSSHCE